MVGSAHPTWPHKRDSGSLTIVLTSCCLFCKFFFVSFALFVVKLFLVAASLRYAIDFMNVRLFIAVEIAEEIRKKVGAFQDALKKADADVGWVVPKNLHITLKFIGAFEEEKIGDIIAIIKDSVSHIRPFDLSYRGVGAFPARKNPRVIFVQIIDANGILANAHERLDNQLRALGVEHEDRRFDAHLTVGRIKTRRNVGNLMEKLDVYAGTPFGAEHVTQVVLMKSDLSPQGPTYTKLAGIDLL